MALEGAVAGLEGEVQEGAEGDDQGEQIAVEDVVEEGGDGDGAEIGGDEGEHHGLGPEAWVGRRRRGRLVLRR